MIGFVSYGDIVLRVVLLLIISLVGFGIVGMVFNVNMIVLIILVVVSSIFTFVLYYMRGDVSSEGFKLLKLLFLRLMVLILSSYGMVIFIG